MNEQNKTLKKAMLEALEKSLGIVTTACKTVGIARGTHYVWMKEDDDYRASVEGLENVALDFAESQLHRQMKENNTSATIFYLKTRGRKRGYVERQENVVTTIDDNGEECGMNIQIEFTGNSEA
ncbi:MAG: hypothetical protein GY928_21565 [Colwellia sp.]|nr:hypothetical protein [Colwellia sp.]